MITTFLVGGFWDRWLQAVLLVLLAYGAAMVALPGQVERLLFAPLGFGFADGGLSGAEAEAYGRFAFAVLGAVIVGWALTLLGLARGPLVRRDPEVWRWTVVAVAAWFVLDTGMSLAVGQAGHAVYNVVFVVLLALPLAALRPEVTAAPD